VGILVAWVWVSETPTVIQLAGTAVILFAVGLALWGAPHSTAILPPAGESPAIPKGEQ